MKRQPGFLLAIGCGVALHMGSALAETFEEVGIVQDVLVEKNIVLVDGKRYKLPNSLQENGSPILFQLKPGQVVNFSGTVDKPEPVIESITVNTAAPMVMNPITSNPTVPQQ